MSNDNSVVISSQGIYRSPRETLQYAPSFATKDQNEIDCQILLDKTSSALEYRIQRRTCKPLDMTSNDLPFTRFCGGKNDNSSHGIRLPNTDRGSSYNNYDTYGKVDNTSVSSLHTLNKGDRPAEKDRLINKEKSADCMPSLEHTEQSTEENQDQNDGVFNLTRRNISILKQQTGNDNKYWNSSRSSSFVVSDSTSENKREIIEIHDDDESTCFLRLASSHGDNASDGIDIVEIFDDDNESAESDDDDSIELVKVVDSQSEFCLKTISTTAARPNGHDCVMTEGGCYSAASSTRKMKFRPYPSKKTKSTGTIEKMSTKNVLDLESNDVVKKRLYVENSRRRRSHLTTKFGEEEARVVRVAFSTRSQKQADDSNPQNSKAYSSNRGHPKCTPHHLNPTPLRKSRYVKYMHEGNFDYATSERDAFLEQERLFREAAARVCNHEERIRNRMDSTPKRWTLSLDQTVCDLSKLPNEHWRLSNPYSRLGIPNWSDIASVKRQYRKLALLYHPDKSNVQDAAMIFHAIKEAYESLVNG